MTRPLLEACGLTVSFDGFVAIDDLDLSIAEGELRFLVGPNGAGKTTLLDAITGLVPPASGEIRFAGRNLDGVAEYDRVRLGISRSFQKPTVFDSLTVIEHLDLSASFRRPFPTLFRRRRGVSQSILRTLDTIDLVDHADRPANQLSHGQKQWLEIGMLLAQEPRLLLLDEPVAGMSSDERVATGGLLQRLAGQRTVVVIEHDMAFLRRFATAVTVMHEGRILSEGSVAEVQADPKVREVYLGRSGSTRTTPASEQATAT